jgi:hypothetical protein
MSTGLPFPFFGVLRQLDPFSSESQPRFLVERANCSLGLLPTFFRLRAEDYLFGPP